MARPETRFTHNGSVRIAYQIVDQEDGGMPLDLVMVPGLVSHLDLVWEDPAHARFCRNLSRFARLVLFDKRGTGLSDRDVAPPCLESRMDDLDAVMDAAEARRPALLGISEGGMMSLAFAAAHPRQLRAPAALDEVQPRLDLMGRPGASGALREGAVKRQRVHSLGVGRGEKQAHHPALGDAEQRRPAGFGGIHHGVQVVHPAL